MLTMSEREHFNSQNSEVSLDRDLVLQFVQSE